MDGSLITVTSGSQHTPQAYLDILILAQRNNPASPLPHPDSHHTPPAPLHSKSSAQKKEPRNPGFLSQHQTNPYFKSKEFRLNFLPYLFAHLYTKNPLLPGIVIIQEIVVLSIFFITNDRL